MNCKLASCALWICFLSGHRIGVAPAMADVINVPADQPTIQAGIDAAISGDVILVAPGTYAELINFNGKPITIRSQDPDDPVQVANTIIDGTGLGGSVVTCRSGESSDSVLQGFLITGGTGTASGTIKVGGGMYNRSSYPSVINCIFTENTAYFGGGIYNWGSSPLIRGCVFMNNRPDFGGAIYNAGGAPKIANCVFRDNYARSGGAMYNINARPSMTNCIFNGNRSSTGAAIFANGSSSHPTFTNCTFFGNFAPSGIYITGCSITLNSCILWNNGGLSNEGKEFSIFNSASAFIRNCNVKGGVPIEATDQGGNIEADPMFIDADGADDLVGTADDDLHLMSGSPCLHAGDVTQLPADVWDLDGDGDREESIPLDMDLLDRMSGSNVDLGAYEFQVPCPADVSPSEGGDGVVDVFDLLSLLGAWGLCLPPCPEDLDDNGAVEVMDLLDLLGAWGSCRN